MIQIIFLDLPNDDLILHKVIADVDPILHTVFSIINPIPRKVGSIKLPNVFFKHQDVLHLLSNVVSFIEI